MAPLQKFHLKPHAVCLVHRCWVLIQYGNFATSATTALAQRYCTSYHGKDGQGSTIRDPLLAAAADVPPELIVPSLYKLLRILPRNGNAAGKKSSQAIFSLSSDQVNDLVAYLHSWETSPPTTKIPH